MVDSSALTKNVNRLTQIIDLFKFYRREKGGGLLCVKNMKNVSQSISINYEVSKKSPLMCAHLSKIYFECLCSAKCISIYVKF